MSSTSPWELLERLGRGSASISELSEPYGSSLTGMKKHVRALEDAELVTTERARRARRRRREGGASRTSKRG